MPTLPILHAGLAPLMGVHLSDFFNSAETMANVIVGGQRRFGYDGVQLSMGVTGEAEALGAHVIQPENGLPSIHEFPLALGFHLDALRERDPRSGGRMPIHFDAVSRTVKQLNGEAFTLLTLRGPMLLATQLRGPEQFLMDMLIEPDQAAELLAFATEVVVSLAKHFLATGADGVVLGEAPCSPGFIAPYMYRETIAPLHARVVHELKQAGWGVVGLHICGNIAPIINDLAATGADFLDVDYQTPLDSALRVADRVVVRGNLDPGRVFRLGSFDTVRHEVLELTRAVAGHRWILSSGCDISPGTPAETIAAFVSAAQSGS